MHPNHLYLLHWARTVAAATPDARILDYGCGAGEVVVEGRRLGLNIVGADVFYEGASSKQEVEARGLLGKVITEMKNGTLEYDDATFDLVVSNQVIEHAADLDATLLDLSRVMKPGAKLLCIFPTKEVIREGHIGIPFVHWFAKGSPRATYALACRMMGLGYFKRDKHVRKWTEDALAWMDEYTFYRTRRDILDAFRAHFSVHLIEPDYARFRIGCHLSLERSEPLSRIVRHLRGSSLVQRVIHRLMGVVLLAEKPLTGEIND